MNVDQTKLGYEIRTPAYTIFFGGTEAQMPALKIAYPDYEFVRLKQIHSDAVVESADSLRDLTVHGDAHYSKTPGLALCVITADCVPVFIHHAKSGFIAGIHAGWRGVASKIIPKTIHQLNAQGVDSSELEVIIGPHIQKQSFEVGRDVRDQILHSIGQVASGAGNSFFENISSDKAVVDLNQVVKLQLQNEGIEHDRLFDLHIDTMTNPFFHSHRRDKEKAGRQISFIVRHRD
ncbi:Laccase domain protein YfiH [compost metagenome]